MRRQARCPARRREERARHRWARPRPGARGPRPGRLQVEGLRGRRGGRLGGRRQRGQRLEAPGSAAMGRAVLHHPGRRRRSPCGALLRSRLLRLRPLSLVLRGRSRGIGLLCRGLPRVGLLRRAQTRRLLLRRGLLRRSLFARGDQLLQPLADRLQRLRQEGVQAPLTLRAHAHQPGLAQDLQVLRDRRLADPQLRDDAVDRARLPLHRPQDASAGGVGDHGEDIGAHVLHLNGGCPGTVAGVRRPAQSYHGSSPHSGNTCFLVTITVRSRSSAGSYPISQERHHTSTSSPISSGARTP
ncbi:Uncharacterised protein [Rothia kristinae]|nr:Uncharacterised protein [Rothia kristinae]